VDVITMEGVVEDNQRDVRQTTEVHEILVRERGPGFDQIP
jgi:hypothetical protein